jgi:hypothetical protein
MEEKMIRTLRSPEEKKHTSVAANIADTAIFIAFSAFFIFTVFAMRYVLYGNVYTPETTENIITENIPVGARALIKKGDVIYDTVTKRAIGTVDYVSPEGDRLRMSVTFIAKPRTDALRTRAVWFKYQVITDSSEDR